MLSAYIMQPRRSGMAAWPRPNARSCRSALADGLKATPAISRSGLVDVAATVAATAAAAAAAADAVAAAATDAAERSRRQMKLAGEFTGRGAQQAARQTRAGGEGKKWGDGRVNPASAPATARRAHYAVAAVINPCESRAGSPASECRERDTRVAGMRETSVTVSAPHSGRLTVWTSAHTAQRAGPAASAPRHGHFSRRSG
eukprot:scaffold8382_cov70-Phaeocystis_antarctica.AAC.4